MSQNNHSNASKSSAASQSTQSAVPTNPKASKTQKQSTNDEGTQTVEPLDLGSKLLLRRLDKNIMSYWEASTPNNVAAWAQAIEAAKQDDAQLLWRALQKLGSNCAISVIGKRGALKKNVLTSALNKLVGKDRVLWQRVWECQKAIDEGSWRWRGAALSDEELKEQQAKQEKFKNPANVQEFLASKDVYQLDLSALLWAVCPMTLAKAQQKRLELYEQDKAKAKLEGTQVPWTPTHRFIGLGESHKNVEPMLNYVGALWLQTQMGLPMQQQEQERAQWIMTPEDQAAMRLWVKALNVGACAQLMEHFEYQAQRTAKGQNVYGRGFTPVPYHWMHALIPSDNPQGASASERQKVFDWCHDRLHEDVLGHVQQLTDQKDWQGVRQWCAQGSQVGLESLDYGMSQKLVHHWSKVHQNARLPEHPYVLPWNAHEGIDHRKFGVLLQPVQEQVQKVGAWCASVGYEWGVSVWAHKRRSYQDPDRLYWALESGAEGGLEIVQKCNKALEQKYTQQQAQAQEKLLQEEKVMEHMKAFYKDRSPVSVKALQKVPECFEGIDNTWCAIGLIEWLSLSGVSEHVAIAKSAVEQGARLAPGFESLIGQLDTDTKQRHAFFEELRRRKMYENNLYEMNHRASATQQRYDEVGQQECLTQVQSVMLAQSVAQQLQASRADGALKSKGAKRM